MPAEARLLPNGRHVHWCPNTHQHTETLCTTGEWECAERDCYEASKPCYWCQLGKEDRPRWPHEILE